MIGHIYFYGIFENWQDSKADEYGYINLNSIMKQVEAQGDVKRIEGSIHSDGGSVDEGFAILNYLNSLSIPFDSNITGSCRSIATIIALAGENRKMSQYGEIMIHNPWGFVGGEKDDLRKYADGLEEIEEKLALYYSERTKISKEEALEYMKNETVFNAEEALEKGFITEIVQKTNAVAYYKPKQKTMKNLSKDENEKLAGFYNLMKGWFGKGDDPKNLTRQDGEGNEIEFPDLDVNETPKEGDKATIDGKPATGEVVMPDGKTWVFEDGIFKGEKEEETEDPKDQEIQNLKDELAQFKTDKEAEIQNLKTEHQNKLDGLETKFNDKFNEFKSSFKPKNKKEDNDGTKKRFGVKVKPE